MTIMHKIVVSKQLPAPESLYKQNEQCNSEKCNRREVGGKRRRFYFDVFVYDYVYFTVQ